MQRLITYLLSALILLPFVLLLGLSLAEAWRFPDVLPEAWTLAHWQQLFALDAELGSSLLLSIGISLFVATLATSSGFLTSRYIAYSPLRERYLLLAYCPFVLSPVVYAACIHYFFIKMGLSGQVGGVLLGQLIIAYPFAVIICHAHWNERLRSMEQLVATLGGSRGAAFRRVILPISKGILLVCFFQTFLISWFEYGLTTLIGVGKVQTMTLKVFQYINEADIYLAALSSWLLFLPPAILLWFNKRFVFREASNLEV
ncbi:MAG: ABC transporter permease [Bacteroidia bacterium]